jgi:RNA polymerase sigma-70 factor (sigma-E family)
MQRRRAGVLDESEADAPADVGDFDDFYRRHYRRMVALVYALSGSRATAEDVAQDVFAVVHRRWGYVRSLDRPDAWLRRVATNMAVSGFRRRLAEGRALARLPRRGNDALPPLPAEAAEFWAAVRALPQRQAQAVALHYMEELSTAEVATVLGCAEATVRVHLHRARRALAARLGVPEEDQ